MSYPKLNKEDFLNEIECLPLEKSDIVICINSNSKIAARLIAESLGVNYEVLRRTSAGQQKQINKFSDKNVLLVSDVSLTGNSLNKAKALFKDSKVSTFAVSGIADHVIYTTPVCGTVLEQLKEKSWLKSIKPSKKWPGISVIVLGLLSLIWLIIRSGTNPKRLAYACQQAAIPFALAFLGYLLGLTGMAYSYRKVKKYVKSHKYVLAFTFILLGLFSYGVFSVTEVPKVFAYTPADGSNNPMGTAKGINPGRVVWAHNPEATDWVKFDGFWWDDTHTSGSVVDNMLEQTILHTAGASNATDAWDAIFKYFNNDKGKGDVGYIEGEKIAIKINLNTARNSHDEQLNTTNPSPHLCLSLVRQLVNNAGVPQTDITIYDATRYITDNIYDKVRAEFPDIVFVDRYGGNGRVISTWTNSVIGYSQGPPVHYCGDRIPQCVYDADYLINMAILKVHAIAGVTLLAKNHYGSMNNQDHGITDPEQSGMDTYHPFVEFMGDDDLGGKTVLNIMDALFGAFNQSGVPDPWQMAPFNNDWPSSILVSQDAVALSSVCVDMLIEERGNNLKNYVDHDLHEMALCDNPPSGSNYDPNGVGGLASLGVHEHWNNATDRQYSRNLDPVNGTGIELVYITDNNVPPTVNLTSPVPEATFDAGNAISLSANANDIDGSIVSVAFYAGNTMINEDATAPYQYSWSNASVGTHIITARATDDQGVVSTSSAVTVYVVDPLAPPVADAGEDQVLVLPTTSTTLDGSGSSDPNDDLLTYSWSQISGPVTAFINDQNAEITSISGLIEGSYIFELEVYDGNSFDTDQVAINVFIVPPIDTLLHDDFNRANIAVFGDPLIGTTWQETEAGGNIAEIMNNTAYFSSTDGANTPLLKNVLESEVTNGMLTWTFDFNWALTGGEGTYEVRMQMGQTSMQDNNNVTGVAVDLIWGGANNGLPGNEYFGYVDNSGTVQSLTQLSGMQTIKVIADLDTKQYDIEVGGVALATDVAFRNPNTTIGVVRFLTNGVNTANFGGRSFDNVLVIKEVENIITNTTFALDKVNSEIELYPNPTDNIVNINGVNTSSEYELYDMHGVLLQKGYSTKIDMSNFTKGIYFLKIDNTTHSILKK